MAITLYEAVPGSLIATGDRTVATHSSGLVRIEQVYVCSSAAASTHRAALSVGDPMPGGDDGPCIDGVFIFPSPQEVKRADGFIEFHVSAYGRTQSTLQNIIIQQEKKQVIPAPGTHGYAFFKVNAISGQIVIPAGGAISMDDIGISDSVLAPYDFYLPKYPEYRFLDATPYSTYTLVVGEYIVDSLFDPTNATVAIFRVYNVRMTTDGSTAALTFPVTIRDPYFEISSFSAFGRFVEIEVSSTTEITPGVVI